MKTFKVITVLSLTSVLTACGGGGKLSFKNADTLIKSYTKTVADMSEKDRQSFGRNIMLVLNDGNTAEADLNLGDWHEAVNEASDLSYLSQSDNELVRAYASDLALRGVDSLDGKSVSYINKQGEDIKAGIVKSSTAALEAEITGYQDVLKQIEIDKEGHQSAYQAALKQEEKLGKEMGMYKVKTTAKDITKNWQGQLLNADYVISNPHEDPLYDTRLEVHVKYKDHLARFSGIRHQFGRYDKGAKAFALNLSPKSFLNDGGGQLDKDHQFSTDMSDYDISVRPAWIRTSGKANGWKEYEYKLTQDEFKAIHQRTARLKQCDQIREQIKKKITLEQERLAVIKSGDLEDLKRNFGWSRGVQKGCAVN